MSRRGPLARIRHLIEVMDIDAINLRDEEAACARSSNPEGRAALLDAAWRRFSASLEAMEDEAARLKQALENALADWQPREANILSDKLEDVLDTLEKAFVA